MEIWRNSRVKELSAPLRIVGSYLCVASTEKLYPQECTSLRTVKTIITRKVWSTKKWPTLYPNISELLEHGPRTRSHTQRPEHKKDWYNNTAMNTSSAHQRT